MHSSESHIQLHGEEGSAANYNVLYSEWNSQHAAKGLL
jgi:hypothetical protein